MTPNARKKHLAAMEEILTNYGFKEDRYGNYLYPGLKTFRIKFKKVNVRQEWKSGNRWMSGGFSMAYSKVSLSDWEARVKTYQHMVIDKIDHQKAKEEPLKIKKITKEEAVELRNEKTHKEDQRRQLDRSCYQLLKKLVDEGHLERLRLSQDTLGLYKVIQSTIKNRNTLV
jgi:hypothetical protein